MRDRSVTGGYFSRRTGEFPARAKKRAKGLKLNRINLIDSHWVVQPDYCIEPLSWAEKAKIDRGPSGTWTTNLTNSSLNAILSSRVIDRIEKSTMQGGWFFTNLH